MIRLKEETKSNKKMEETTKKEDDLEKKLATDNFYSTIQKIKRKEEEQRLWTL